MTIRHLRFFLYITAVGFCAARASATVLFSDDFNTNNSGNWTVNAAPTANASQQGALWAFDYSGFGIPPAPGSADTLGLRLRANVPGSDAAPVLNRPVQAVSGLSVSPTGKNFGTNYVVQFYAWSNFFGAPNALGLADNANSAGGTNNILFALGTSGTVPLVVGNTSAVTNSTIDGVAFATTADGGITNDFRAYPKTNAIGATTLLAANSYANTNAFYTAKFPAVSAPSSQAALATGEFDEGTGFNPMAGSTQAGSFGFAWHKVEMKKNNNSVTWSIDDNLFATVDTSAITLGGNNIALGQSDVNTSTAQHPSLLFTVFDNLTVTDIPSTLTGDHNSDGKVNAADYVAWAVNPGGHGGTPGGYNDWRGNFGAGSGAGALVDSAVPEPTSLLLLLSTAAAFGGLRRKR
jgi:hypothetical protein